MLLTLYFMNWQSSRARGVGPADYFRNARCFAAIHAQILSVDKNHVFNNHLWGHDAKEEEAWETADGLETADLQPDVIHHSWI